MFRTTPKGTPRNEPPPLVYRPPPKAAAPTTRLPKPAAQPQSLEELGGHLPLFLGRVLLRYTPKLRAACLRPFLEIGALQRGHTPHAPHPSQGRDLRSEV